MSVTIARCPSGGEGGGAEIAPIENLWSKQSDQYELVKTPFHITTAASCSQDWKLVLFPQLLPPPSPSAQDGSSNLSLKPSSGLSHTAYCQGSPASPPISPNLAGWGV